MYRRKRLYSQIPPARGLCVPYVYAISPSIGPRVSCGSHMRVTGGHLGYLRKSLGKMFISGTYVGNQISYIDISLFLIFYVRGFYRCRAWGGVGLGVGCAPC